MHLPGFRSLCRAGRPHTVCMHGRVEVSGKPTKSPHKRNSQHLHIRHDKGHLFTGEKPQRTSLRSLYYLQPHPHPHPCHPQEEEMEQGSSVQFSHSVVSDSLRPHELQHARPPCPSPTPRVYSNSRPIAVMPSNQLILCCPLLLPLSVFPRIRVSSN